MRSRLLPFAFFFLWMIPNQAFAQVWELDVGWARIDHDPPRWLTLGAEQIPDGLGAHLRRSVWRPGLFLGLEITHGSEEVKVEKCGLADPSACGKLVRYSGGASTITLSWLGEIGLTRILSASIRPEMGFGGLRGVRAREPDLETITDFQLIGKIGISARMALQIGEKSAYSIHLTGGAASLRPVLRVACDDCIQFFTRPLPQYSLALGLRREGR